MAARGYAGTMPNLASDEVQRKDYLTAAVPGGIAVVALVTAVVLR